MFLFDIVPVLINLIIGKTGKQSHLKAVQNPIELAERETKLVLISVSTWFSLTVLCTLKHSLSISYVMHRLNALA